jgi:hypothetical protein
MLMGARCARQTERYRDRLVLARLIAGESKEIVSRVITAPRVHECETKWRHLRLQHASTGNRARR